MKKFVQRAFSLLLGGIVSTTFAMSSFAEEEAQTKDKNFLE